MSAYVLPLWTPPSLPVFGREERFPVRRVFCIGRNYADHVREMGGDPNRGQPIFFMKPADAVLGDNAALPYPSATADLHHEVELVAALGPDLKPIAYAVGLDMTRRDRQGEAKKTATPWEIGKAFEGSGLCAPLMPAADWSGPGSERIHLEVNGETRQDGRLDQMVWTMEEILEELQARFTLKPGDLVFTGTPAGVGPVVRGDRLEARIEGLPPLVTHVV